MSSEQPIVIHQGVYQPVATVSEAVFMITGMTIGAGILGIPYVVSKIGLIPGLMYILVLGLTMMSLNLMIGEIAVRTAEPLQLSGFAGKYLGGWAKDLMSVVVFLSSAGALLAYLAGESVALSALFGGSAFWWGIGFWVVASLMVVLGLGAIKRVVKYLSLTVIILIVGLSLFLLPKSEATNFVYYNWSYLFLPYGVILFALHASPAIAEAHALLPGSQRHFRKAIMLGALIPTVVYMLFAMAVTGVTGLGTTEVATIGLGLKFGGNILIVANVFAILAMATAFLGMATALKQTLHWDHKINERLAVIITLALPLLLFLLRPQSFVNILDLTGGLFVGIEAVLMVLVYVSARKFGNIKAGRYALPSFWIMAVPVLLIFTLATVFSLIKMMK